MTMDIKTEMELSKLAVKRVNDAIRGVTQLMDRDEQATRVAQCVIGAVAITMVQHMTSAQRMSKEQAITTVLQTIGLALGIEAFAVNEERLEEFKRNHDSKTTKGSNRKR